MAFNFDRIDQLPTATARDARSPLAMPDLKVIDFTHFVAGPLATMMLADFGAEIIKVEAYDTGEDFRQYGPHDDSLPNLGAPFIWTNRGKKSLSVDLKSERGLALVRELIAKADVVIENFSTGVMERFGLDQESCRRTNPRLIYCSVSAYGRTGEFADRLGFDPIVQAESGFMSLNGYPDQEGVRTTSTVMDIATAMMAANAVMAALLARTHTGKGQHLEVTLFDTAMLMTGFVSMQALCSDRPVGRTGNHSVDTAPSGVFRAADRSFYINCGNTRIFKRLFTEVLERPDIAEDPAYADAPGRIARREQLFGILNTLLAKQPWSYWRLRLRKAGVPSGDVRTIPEALASEEVAARGLVTRIPHPQGGWLPNMRLPFAFSDTPMADPTPAPAVGQHSAEILKSHLGLDDEQIAGLQRDRVVYCGTPDAEAAAVKASR